MSTAPVIRLAPPAYTIDEDDVRGVVRMKVEGFFDLDTLRRHFAENAAFVNRWRAQGRPIRVLINAVDLHPHSPEGQALVQQSVARIYMPGDRVAVTVASSLVKMQIRRALTHGDIVNVFVSDLAAMTWLMAYA